MAVKPVLPVPGSDWRSWALQLVQSLQGYFGGNLSVTPIYDTSGRVIVDTDGIYVYDPITGVNLISPSLVEIDTSHLADAAVTTAKLANLAVDNDKLAALAVDAAKLANSSVTSTKIANLAVGSAAIQAAAIGTSHIANAAITSALIGDAEIVEAKIADLAVTDAKINTVTANKLRAGTIGAYLIYLGDGTFLLDGGNKYLLVKDNQTTPVERVKIGKLGAGDSDYGIEIKDPSGDVILSSGGTYGSAIANSSQQWSDVSGTGKPADNADVTSANPQAASWLTDGGAFATLDQITAANISTYIAAAAIDTAYIKDAAITNAKINDLSASKIDTGTLSADRIAAGSLNGNKITAGTITADRLQANSITSGYIAAGAITAAGAEIADAAVQTLKIAGNAVTVPSGGSTDGTSAVTTSAGSPTTATSASINSGGYPVMVQATFHCTTTYSGGSSSVGVWARITRGGTKIWPTSSSFALILSNLEGSDVESYIALTYRDNTGTSTSQTYAVEVYHSASNANIKFRSMTLLGVKR